MLYQAISASAFVDSLGVNLHSSWSGVAPYSNTQAVMNAMDYLGVTAARDYMNGTTAVSFNTMAQAGFRFDLIYNPGDNIATYVSQVHNLEAAHPGSVLSVEGPNEINDMLAQATAIQKDLYTRINTDPLLANKPVYAATIAGIDPSVYSQLQIAGYADNGNVHIYYNGGMPSYGLPGNSTWSFDNWLKSGTWDVPGKPVVITETGASNFPSGGGVDDNVQARQILDAVMDAGVRGVPMTYIYELADSQPFWSNNDLNGHWGLFHSDFTPKLAATGLHNLTTILTDGGRLAGAPGTLDYTIQGNLSTGGQMLLQEGDGTKDIVVWSEPDIWNENTHTEIAAPNTPVTIDLAKAANVQIYDPLNSANPIQSLGLTSHITVNVTDHPVIIEVKDATSGGTTPPPPTSPSPPSAPAAPSAPTLAAASDLGSSNTDHITSDATPTVSGTAVAGSTVNLLDGSTQVGSATTDSSGHWTITSSTLGDGAHTLTATAATSGGTSAASGGLAVTIDTHAPSAPSTPDLAAASDDGASSTDNVTSITTPIFTGSVASAPNAVVTLYDGTTVIGSTTVDSTGGWSITSKALAVGTHAISATATDVAGNVSAASSALSVSIVSGATAPTPPPPPPPTTPSAPTAPTALDLTAASDHGRSSTDNITNDATPTITGSAAAGSTVKLFDGATQVGSATTDGTGHWTIDSSTLADGAHTLTATATNSAGTSAASSGLALTIDTHAPSAPTTPDLATASDNGASSTDNVTSITTPTFTGSVANAPNALVTLYDGSTAVGSATVDGSGNWSITSQALSSGTHTITATATDVAGNVSAASGTLSVSISGTPSSPTPPVVAGQVLTGGNAANALTGGAGNDTLSGMRGADTLVGGAGDDQLSGGPGADHFVFQPGFGHDTITDFSHSARDVLNFNGFSGAQPTIADTSAGITLTFNTGDSVLLSGVHSLSSSDWIVA